MSSDEKLKEGVRQEIRNGSTFNLAYLIMNTLATVIACYGLFANSPAVVIGAMIVAMLLGPITGIALGLVDNDAALLRKAFFTLLGGVIGVMFTAFIVGLIHRNIPITNEIMARTSPNLLDLMIALAGGAAGAYATVSPRLSVAFVGVAIATALVPPLASSGILLARGEYRLAFGAFLLAFTNMVAIQFASSTVMWVNGFRHVSQVRGLNLITFMKRNAISLLILAVLAILLETNLRRAVSNQLHESEVRLVLEQAFEASPGSRLIEVYFDKTKAKTIVRAVVRGTNPPAASQVASIEAKLPLSADRTATELRIRFVQTMIINRDGLLNNDVEIGTHE